MDRPLFKLTQFEQFIGHTVQVNLFKPVGGRRKITGLIEKVEDSNVYLQQDGQVSSTKSSTSISGSSICATCNEICVVGNSIPPGNSALSSTT
jgi:ribosome maturation factor RimP